ncbi:RNA polymerase sigma factor [Roseiconus lacunae]|uniref:Sigma-70 family RNA polymerase sigma factor n=1 Tax=Roseiconus lacunae TaxID=2605694 RepID=A0ABT7PNH5_9BACT|nr:sigma-70 family RNA polymerase sigma factor [Roseiconus lacunae]MDM4017701.1 sigma-70 family RNA polymerase sigma factor [Roseiconus lacunae]
MASDNESNLLLEFESQFRRLAHRMLRTFPGVRRWEETDDVVQAALVRLHRSIESIQIQSPLHLRRLAALQIRRELLNFAQRHSRKGSYAANHESCLGSLPSIQDRPDHPTLEEWGRFHQCVEELPKGVLEVFEMIWYTGLSQQEAALQLGISLRQCQRRWTTARMMIARKVCQQALLS